MASVFSGLPHNLILDIIKTELDRQKSELDTLDYWTRGVGGEGINFDDEFCQDLGDWVDMGEAAGGGGHWEQATIEREGWEQCRPFWLKSRVMGDIRMLGDHNKLVQKGGHYDGEVRLIPQKKLPKHLINRKTPDINYIPSIIRRWSGRVHTAREVKVNLRMVRELRLNHFRAVHRCYRLSWELWHINRCNHEWVRGEYGVKRL